MDPYYQPPLAALMPGDIFQDVPSVYLRDDRVTFIRRWKDKRGPLGYLYEFGDTETAPKQPFDPNQDEAVVPIQVAHAILLTNGCELDNRPNGPLTLALIRPLAVVQSEHQENIRKGYNLSFLPLPANDDPEFAESYVDFSRITSVRPEVVAGANRILSPSPDLLRALYVGVVRYFTRLDVQPGLIESQVEDAFRTAADAK